MAKKKFAEMSPSERAAWLSEEASGGRITNDYRSVVERLRDVLEKHGPMTVAEVAERMHYRKKDSLIAWSNRKAGRDKMAEYGIIKHYSPDDGRTGVWLLDIHLQEDEDGNEPTKRASVFDRMSSKRE